MSIVDGFCFAGTFAGGFIAGRFFRILGNVRVELMMSGWSSIFGGGGGDGCFGMVLRQKKYIENI